MTSNQVIRWLLKPAVFIVALVPFAWLAWAVTMALNGSDLAPLRLFSALFGYSGGLGADPLKDITNETGLWTLRFLCITLTITPLRRITGWNAAVRFRRMLGLFAFFYGTLHLLVFIVFDRLAGMGFPSLLALQTMRDLATSIGGEIAKRPYITVGFTAWVCMLALAATSTAGMVRRLGGKRWRALHRLVYVAAVAGVLHYLWLVKADIRDPAVYAVIVGLLLLIRVFWVVQARVSAPLRAASVSRS